MKRREGLRLSCTKQMGSARSSLHMQIKDALRLSWAVFIYEMPLVNSFMECRFGLFFTMEY